jgi:hypothetical protein
MRNCLIAGRQSDYFFTLVLLPMASAGSHAAAYGQIRKGVF